VGGLVRFGGLHRSLLRLRCHQRGVRGRQAVPGGVEFASARRGWRLVLLGSSAGGRASSVPWTFSVSSLYWFAVRRRAGVWLQPLTRVCGLRCALAPRSSLRNRPSALRDGRRGRSRSGVRCRNPSRRVSVRSAAVPWIAPESVCRASRANGPPLHRHAPGRPLPLTCSRLPVGFGSRLPASTSCSVLVVSHHLDGLLRPALFGVSSSPCGASGFPFPSRGVAGLLHPAANPGVRLRFALTKTAVSGGLCVELPAARFAPLEGVPFPTAVSRRRDPCPLAVFTTSRPCSVVKSVIRRSHCCEPGCSPSWASIPSEVPSGSWNLDFRRDSIPPCVRARGVCPSRGLAI